MVVDYESSSFPQKLKREVTLFQIPTPEEYRIQLNATTNHKENEDLNYRTRLYQRLNIIYKIAWAADHDQQHRTTLLKVAQPERTKVFKEDDIHYASALLLLKPETYRDPKQRRKAQKRANEYALVVKAMLDEGIVPGEVMIALDERGLDGFQRARKQAKAATTEAAPDTDEEGEEEDDSVGAECGEEAEETQAADHDRETDEQHGTSDEPRADMSEPIDPALVGGRFVGDWTGEVAGYFFSLPPGLYCAVIEIKPVNSNGFKPAELVDLWNGKIPDRILKKIDPFKEEDEGF